MIFDVGNDIRACTDVISVLWMYYIIVLYIFEEYRWGMNSESGETKNWYTKISIDAFI